MTWFARHKNEIQVNEHIPFIILRSPDSFNEQEAVILKNQCENTYYCEDIVMPLIQHYQIKFTEFIEKQKSAESNAILEILIDLLLNSIVFFK